MVNQSESHPDIPVPDFSSRLARRMSSRRYLETDVERRAWIYILEVTVLLAGVNVHLIVHRDRWQVLIGETIGQWRDQNQGEHAKQHAAELHEEGHRSAMGITVNDVDNGQDHRNRLTDREQIWRIEG